MKLLIVIGLILLTGNAFAQSSTLAPPLNEDTVPHSITETSFDPEIKFGAEIRVNPKGGSLIANSGKTYLYGQFQYLADGVLSMAVDGTIVRVPVDEIYQMQVRTGGSGSAWSGAILGLISGGALAAATQPDRSDESFGGLSHMGEDIARGTVIVVLGVAVGAAIGSALDPGKWEKVEFQHQTFSLMGQTDSNFRLAYSLRF